MRPYSLALLLTVSIAVAAPEDALAQAKTGHKPTSTTKSAAQMAPKSVKAPEFSATQQARITEAETYMNRIKSLIADYVQIAPDGALTSGKMYLMRPGKMRWQYDPPTPILMIANGTFLTFIDYELNQVTNVPLDQTLAGFLARNDIEFGKDVVVTDVEEKPGSLRLTLVQQARPDDGTLKLEFALNPMQLRNFVIKDAVGQETTVSLNNAQFDVPLDGSLFVFEDPRNPQVGSKKTGVQR